MTVRAEVTLLGAFPVALGEFYGSQGIIDLGGAALLAGGTTIKIRGFTNSGNPSTRKLNVTFTGQLASDSAWDSLIL